MACFVENNLYFIKKDIMMNNSVFIIPFFIIIFHQFLIPFSIANPSMDEKMLIAFMKGQKEIQLSEYSNQKYEAHLGIMHYMRKNWQCDKIGKNFDEYERTECQKYRKYLDILYEYLHREYAGIPTVKPKFILKKKQFEFDGPIICAISSLVNISQFYFISSSSEYYEYKLDKLFIHEHAFAPKIKLVNEKRLNYELKLEKEQKMPINEMILQLAIDTANEWQINENLNGLIRQNFEKKLEEMLKKAEKRAKKDKPRRANKINDDKHKIIIDSKFRMDKEYSNFFYQLIEKGNIHRNNDRCMINCGTHEFEKRKKHFKQIYQSHLGLVYLMRENWHCEKIGEEFKEKCQKYRKYLDILYEYLFSLYAQAKTPNVLKQLSSMMKPIFIDYFYPMQLIQVIGKLNEISECFWKKGINELRNFNGIKEMNLVNEEDFHYEMRKEKSEQNSTTKNETEIVNLRKEFEQKMKKLCKNAPKKAKDEMAKTEIEIRNTENRQKRTHLVIEYIIKFGNFSSSPFS